MDSHPLPLSPELLLLALTHAQKVPHPITRGVPGEGPDCHFPYEIGGFGPDPGGLIYF